MNYCVAIDGGGSKTRAGLYDENGSLLSEAEGPASNIAGKGPQDVVHIAQNLLKKLSVSSVDVIAGGFAGIESWNIKTPVAQSFLERFDVRKVVISNDLAPLKLAHFGNGEGIVAVAGTGSCVWAANNNGETTRRGGFGHAIGDPCSGYTIVVETISEVLYKTELGEGIRKELAKDLMTAAEIGSLRDFPAWVQQSAKSKVAALCPVVLNHAENGDELLITYLEKVSHRFATSVRSAQKQLNLSNDVPTVLAGGIFENSALVFNLVQNALHSPNEKANVTRAQISGHHASWYLSQVKESNGSIVVAEKSATGPATDRLPETESMDLDRGLDSMTSKDIVATMGSHNVQAASAVDLVASEVASAMEAAATSFNSGGRLIYLGAGTSGRLGVLDASECPPTFGVSDWAVGIMAGGDTALRNSVEGAEDDPDQAIADLNALDPPVNSNDFVVGITASGTATYVLSTLSYAKKLPAQTALVCCNPVPADTADIIISIPTGTEILPGSTRLKAGTATKMVLNMITTGAMALSGHIFDGYMVGMRPVNIKLRQRAIRIVQGLTKVSMDDAEQLLDQANGCIKTAVLMKVRNLSSSDANSLLEQHQGKLRNALES